MLQFFLTAPKNNNTLTILVLGQSNAGNRNNITSLPTLYQYIVKNYPNVKYIEYHDSVSQYTGTTVLGNYDKSSGMFGIELGFLSVFSKKQINVIKYFYGSKALKQQSGDNDFHPNSINDLYNIGIFKGDNTGFCEKVCNANNLKPDIVIWIQGEQDAVINSQTYLTDLQALTTALRNDFNNPNLTFIYNQLHSSFYYYSSAEHAEPGRTYVRNGQSSFNDNNLNKLINYDDVPIGDIYNVHLDANASAQLGIRIGNFAKLKYGD